jgi:hypothetical protein
MLSNRNATKKVDLRAAWVIYVNYLESKFPPQPSLNHLRKLLIMLLPTTNWVISVRYLLSYSLPRPGSSPYDTY